MSDSRTPGASQVYPVTDRALGLPLLVLSALQLMVVLDGTVVIFALARLKTELGLSEIGASWVVTSYTLTFGGLLLLGGRLGDAFARRRVFAVGVALFTVSSLACGLAVNEGMLLVARSFQGIGAAIASPSAMAMVVLTFAPGRVRNQAFSVYAMMTGIGSVAGLVVGGALTELSWRWIFLINVPIGALIIAGVRSLPTPSGRRVELDIRGAVLATLGCTALVFALSTGERGWGRPEVLGGIVLGVLLLVLFFRSQRVVAEPLLPPRLFASPSRVAVFVGLLLAGAVMMTMTVNVALFVQEVLGFSPLRAGVSFIPFTLALGLGTEVASRLCLRVAPRWVVAAGAASLTLGLLYASTLREGVEYFPGLLLPTLVIGFGIGVTLIPLTLSVVAGVLPEDVGALTSAALVAQNLGGPIGLVGAGSLAATVGQPYTFPLVVAAVLAALMIPVVMRSRFTPKEIAAGQEAERASHNL